MDRANPSVKLSRIRDRIRERLKDRIRDRIRYKSSPAFKGRIPSPRGFKGLFFRGVSEGLREALTALRIKNPSGELEPALC